MLYREISPGTFVPWDGKAIGSSLPPPDIETHPAWTDADRAALGLYKPTDPGIPEGKRATGPATVQRIGGVVTFVYPLEDVPPPTLDEQFPPLDPWRFWATVNMPGSIGEANLRAAISGHENPMFAAVAMARLNNPPGGRFVRSDPMFADAALLGALGIDEATVNTLWSQGHAIPDPVHPA